MKQFLLALALLGAINTFAQTLEDDRLALIALYNSTNGSGWINKTGWVVPGATGDSPCGWFGVTCNAQGNRVVEVNLPHNYLLGPLPIEIGSLTALTRLDLDQLTPMMAGVRFNDGSLTGTLPTQLGDLVNLKHLDLGGNRFSGSIPASIGNLVNLELLDLSYTSFDAGFDHFGTLSGPIPDLSALPATAKVHINNQSFTFDGMEQNITRLAQYSPQNLIELLHGRKYQLGDPEYDPEDYHEFLWVNAGGAESFNEYKLFRDDNVESTQIGDKWFGYSTGTYKIEVKNALVPGLTLISNEDFFFTGPIPVTLIGFIVKSEIFKNHLTWKTTSETNNAGFEVHKSSDAKTFEKIGFVDSNGDSKEIKTYSFTDANPFSTTYYRLKQIDFDGKFEYSRIVSVKNESMGLAIYPNPVQNQLFISNLKRPEEVLIRDLSGKVFLKETAKSKVPVNTSNFPSGLYFITVGNETRKFLVQK